VHIDDLIDTHSTRLYRLAYFYLHDPEAARDAVQESFLRYIKEGASVHNPGAWLNRVLRNGCLNVLRKKNREGWIDLFNLPDEQTENWEANVAESLTVTDALMRLPLIYRDVLVWRYYLQQVDQEIADQLGISHDALRTRLTRARKALAQLLKEEEQ
jgi:RNA polymerase sigma-70 factor (ECF subfamily)